VTHLQLSRQTRDPDLVQAVRLLKQTLNILDLRWRSAGMLDQPWNGGELTIDAGAHLQVLEAREVMGIA
jgi:hypothetical protein